MRSDGGFTLIEMCIVLLIIAMLAGLAMPAFRSALTEQAVRRDSHQLALMVKTAMIQCSEQHRNYVLDLSGTTMALHPQGAAAAEDDSLDSISSSPAPTNAAPSAVTSAADANAAAAENTTNSDTPIDVVVTTTLDPANKLKAPDPKKDDSWIDMPDGTEWVFQPGTLCPATRVRIERGDAYIELTFNALTGNVDDEKSSIP